jgi:hypothetical protein
VRSGAREPISACFRAGRGWYASAQIVLTLVYVGYAWAI